MYILLDFVYGKNFLENENDFFDVIMLYLNNKLLTLSYIIFILYLAKSRLRHRTEFLLLPNYSDNMKIIIILLYVDYIFVFIKINYTYCIFNKLIIPRTAINFFFISLENILKI